MDIDVPLKDWGPVDTSILRETILAQEEIAWDEETIRQEDYDVHKQTRSIVMLFASLTWPKVTITREAGWDRLAAVANPIMDDIIERFYKPGGMIIRAVAARLTPGGRISPHYDSLESFKHGHRIHIPIATNDRVRFMIEGRPYRFEVGHVYEINNIKTHSVINAGKEDRIHFIFDYVPADVAKQQNAEFING